MIAAETLARGGVAVTVFDRMANPGRKLLLAGRGGLNLTHSEPREALLQRYGAATKCLSSAIEAFSPDDLRAWCEGLGQATFVGTSGRVFPKAMKSSPLLRAWLLRLRELGVQFETRMLWQGWTPDGELTFAGREQPFKAAAVVLALGGASWPRLGSDGGWAPLLAARGVDIAPLTPANCGVVIAWSDLFRSRFSGEPLKRIALTAAGISARGEAMVTTSGLEGGAVYQLGPALRQNLTETTGGGLTLDLRPDFTIDELATKLYRPRGKQSVSNHLRKSAGLPPVAVALLHEAGAYLPADVTELAKAIKSVPLHVTSLAPIERAISTAGGIAWPELDPHFMLRKLPSVFAAGEMLDWEAPTGGYLLQACFSTGVAAAKGVLAYLE